MTESLPAMTPGARRRKRLVLLLKAAALAAGAVALWTAELLRLLLTGPAPRTGRTSDSSDTDSGGDG
ncbi:hypothetical protein [Streptomyces sp. NPDC001315]|uniref:hypothetical protein n=1 Tax=Streptomyces sp. NPDC001315 TaxID=3364562 RepID=UPI0036ABD62B